MKFLLNELAFHNQFSSFEDFQQGALRELIIFFKLEEKGFIEILKKTDFYNREVYDNITLKEILTAKSKEGRSEEIRKLKSQLNKIINNPYWDTNIKCSTSHNYRYSQYMVNNTCLAEAYEREYSIISVSPSSFLVNNLVVEKSELKDINKFSTNKNIQNFYCSKKLVEQLYALKKISFFDYCIYYFRDTKLSFKRVNKAKSFSLLKKGNDEQQYFNSFKVFSSLQWNDILKQSGKKNKTGLAYQKYHKQSYFSSYSYVGDIYKFRCTEKYRVFGYRENDIFYALEFDLTHSLSD